MSSSIPFILLFIYLFKRFMSVCCFYFNVLLGKGQEYWDEENIIEEMPACRQMFNIFHPFDPVAYRSALNPFITNEHLNNKFFISISLSLCLQVVLIS